MTMQDEPKKKNIEINCNNCTKFLGFYIGFPDTIFKSDFYCSLKCIEDHETKRKKQTERITEHTLK